MKPMRTCAHCNKNVLEYVVWDGRAFCTMKHAVAQAVGEEQQTCAEIAHDVAQDFDTEDTPSGHQAAVTIERAIRSRMKRGGKAYP